MRKRFWARILLILLLLPGIFFTVENAYLQKAWAEEVLIENFINPETIIDEATSIQVVERDGNVELKIYWTAPAGYSYLDFARFGPVELSDYTEINPTVYAPYATNNVTAYIPLSKTQINKQISRFISWDDDDHKQYKWEMTWKKSNGTTWRSYYILSPILIESKWFNQNPTINLTTSDNQALGELATFDVTTSDEDAGDTLTYTISVGSTPGGTDYNGGLSHVTGIYRGTFTVNFDTSVIPSSNLVWNGTRDEEVVYITATVDDGKGGNDIKSMSFIVYNNRPTVNIISPNDNDWKN